MIMSGANFNSQFRKYALLIGAGWSHPRYTLRAGGRWAAAAIATSGMTTGKTRMHRPHRLNEEQAAVVRSIFEMFASGNFATFTICRFLEEREGIVTQRGCRFGT